MSIAKRNAQIEHISIAGLKERMGPIALHVYAQSFLTAARSLPAPTVPFEPVRPYLVCHAIELALKAFLSLQGETMIELANKNGHNLEELLQTAKDRNINAIVPLTDNHCAAIRLASIYYMSKVFEYPAVGEALSCYPNMPSIETLFDVATVAVDTLRQPCLEAK